MREVVVIGCGMTKFGELWKKSLRDIFVEAALKAIDDAGVDHIDSMYVGAMTPGLFVGQEHISALMADYLGVAPIPAMRVESACCSSGMALRLGLFEISSGHSDVILVGGFSWSLRFNCSSTYASLRHNEGAAGCSISKKSPQRCDES
jgi:acetyl-CoA C-acetyltransferase